jgi:hypothetical protein
MSGGQIRHLAARGPRVPALSVSVSLRFAYVAVLRILAWLAWLAWVARAKDAEILILRHLPGSRIRPPILTWAAMRPARTC